MSSANILAVAEGARRSVTSFTKILNKRGPRTLPCGTLINYVVVVSVVVVVENCSYLEKVWVTVEK